MTCSWSFGPPDFGLPGDEVHVWLVSLEQPAEFVQQSAQQLSADELERAARFHFERDRRRFIVARSALRTILSRYVGAEPSKLRFRYETGGKPFLGQESRAGAVRFNLAHSNECAVCAVVHGREVGIDVEHIHPIPGVEQIVTRYFSKPECSAFQSLAESQKLYAFFACWTRKEAFVKATGEGLLRRLDQFSVSLVPGEPARLLEVAWSPDDVARWSLKSLEPAQEYVAAVAVEGHDAPLRYWQYV